MRWSALYVFLFLFLVPTLTNPSSLSHLMRSTKGRSTSEKRLRGINQSLLSRRFLARMSSSQREEVTQIVDHSRLTDSRHLSDVAGTDSCLAALAYEQWLGGDEMAGESISPPDSSHYSYIPESAKTP